MYEQLKELPDFNEYCDLKLKHGSQLPSISDIRRRHYLLQGTTGLDNCYGETALEAAKRRFQNDKLEISSKPSRSYYLKHVYPIYELDEVYTPSWQERDRSIERIVDENTNRAPRFYYRGIDNLDFVGKNFYQSPDKIDLKLKKPRKGFAGSIVDRAMYW